MSVWRELRKQAEELQKQYSPVVQEALKILNNTGLDIDKLQKLVDQRIDEYNEDKCSGEEFEATLEAYRLACYILDHAEEMMDNLIDKLGPEKSAKLLEELEEEVNK